MQQIKVSVIVMADIQKVWSYFTQPQHIKKWNFASPEWHCPSAENNLKPGGAFKFNMAAKDGSFSFDFEGIYTEIKYHETIHYTIADGRKVSVIFNTENNKVAVTEIFEAESIHSIEQQEQGWQSILTGFKNYVEEN